MWPASTALILSSDKLTDCFDSKFAKSAIASGTDRISGINIHRINTHAVFLLPVSKLYSDPIVRVIPIGCIRRRETRQKVDYPFNHPLFVLLGDSMLGKIVKVNTARDGLLESFMNAIDGVVRLCNVSLWKVINYGP